MAAFLQVLKAQTGLLTQHLWHVILLIEHNSLFVNVDCALYPKRNNTMIRRSSPISNSWDIKGSPKIPLDRLVIATFFIIYSVLTSFSSDKREHSTMSPHCRFEVHIEQETHSPRLSLTMAMNLSTALECGIPRFHASTEPCSRGGESGTDTTPSYRQESESVRETPSPRRTAAAPL